MEMNQPMSLKHFLVAGALSGALFTGGAAVAWAQTTTPTDPPPTSPTEPPSTTTPSSSGRDAVHAAGGARRPAAQLPGQGHR